MKITFKNKINITVFNVTCDTDNEDSLASFTVMYPNFVFIKEDGVVVVNVPDYVTYTNIECSITEVFKLIALQSIVSIVYTDKKDKRFAKNDVIPENRNTAVLYGCCDLHIEGVYNKQFSHILPIKHILLCDDEQQSEYNSYKQSTLCLYPKNNNRVNAQTISLTNEKYTKPADNKTFAVDVSKIMKDYNYKKIKAENKRVEGSEND